ncbi:unnamed protein product, partial [Sphagnum compactum]
GDILFLHMSKAPIRAGKIVVFHVDGRDIPIVHRVITLKICSNGLLKDRPVIVWFHCAGDNNLRDDRGLYAHGQMWLQSHHIMGQILPYLGWVTIIMMEKPYIKYLLIGALGLLVITTKE